jgi:hypothetical protein
VTAIDSAIEVRLKASAAVAALVGTRVHFDALPLVGRAFPAIRISKVSDKPDPKVPGEHFARVQVSAYDDPPTVNGERSPAVVEALASAIVTLFHMPQLGSQPTAWTTGGTPGITYRIMNARAEPGPRLTEPGSEYLHIPIDVLVDFRE